MKRRKQILSLLLGAALTMNLTLPAAAGYGNPDPREENTAVIHTVQRADNMWKLAQDNGTTLQQLMGWNPQIKDPSRIYVGDKVVVGHQGASAQPRTTPAPVPSAPAPTAAPAESPIPVGQADLVLKNGTIQTMVGETDVAQAVAVQDGEIVYVGDNAGVTAYEGPGTNVIDLAGRYVTPGFIDGHIHYPVPYLTAETELSLMNVPSTLDAYKTALSEFVAAHPDYEIYLVNSMDLKAFPDSKAENTWLDEICPDKPVKCIDLSSHGELVNTKALALCGVTKDTQVNGKGTIYKDDNGELTGYFSDCGNLLTGLPQFEYSDEEYIDAFLAFQEEASSYGLTGLDSGGDDLKPYHYAQMVQDGTLNLRVNYNFFDFPPLGSAKAQEVIDYISAQEEYESDFLNVRQVKFTLDGVPEGKSSYLLEPYDPAAGMEADYVASPAAGQEELNEFTAAVNAAGYTVQIHSMGDASVQMANNAYQFSQQVNGDQQKACRNKIAHVNLLTASDMTRMADLEVVAAMQPLWFYYDPFFSPLEEQMFGAQRFASEYHIRDMIEAGIKITGSNDYPVTLDFAPLHAIEAGVTQCSPYPGEDSQPDVYTRNADQTVSAYEMLKMYTVNAAYAAFLDDRAGTVEVGKKADLVVLGQNILTCAPSAISDTEVVYTISDGRIVYTSVQEQQADTADLVLKNGHIQTMVSEDDVAQAVAILDSEIVYVGDDAGAADYVGSNTQVIDLDGKFVSPGFMDGHLHVPGMWLDRLFNISLEGMSTNEAYLAAIKKFVDANPDMEIYSGRPFMLNAYQKADGTNAGPSKVELDAICADKPIMIKDVSGHNLWVNSKALEIAGITRDTKDPDGGRIYRDANGEPSGCLADNALALVTNKIEVETTDQMYSEAIEAFMKEANSMGITGVTNFTRGGPTINKIYHELDVLDQLTLRMRIATTLDVNTTEQKVMQVIQSGAQYKSDMINTGVVKIFYDGVTESGTAVMLAPYTPAAGKGDNWRGEPIWSDEDFFRFVQTFDAAGIQVHIHAIGDGAVHKSLDAIQAAQKANGEKDSRFTITHVCAIAPEDITRAAELKVVMPLQFLWMYADPLYELEAAYVGAERAQAFYPTKDMWDAGCIISGASDAPVTPYDVLDEIEVGVTRNSPYAAEEQTDMHRWPEQALTPYQMLEVYTKNVAYQNFMEDMIGTVETGKKADLVVLDQNILTCAPNVISDTEVVYTISDGRIVYQGQ